MLQLIVLYFPPPPSKHRIAAPRYAMTIGECVAMMNCPSCATISLSSASKTSCRCGGGSGISRWREGCG